MDSGEQENNLGGRNGVAKLLQEIAEAEGESQDEEEEHREEDNDVKPLGLLLLGATLDLNEEDCAGNDHGWGKEEEVEGIHGDERHLAVPVFL